MHRPPPPLNFIRAFECAARHLSFTRAAEELGYTQAAISMQVRALEKYLGRALFVRSARSLALTEMGEAFLPTLRQALSQIDSATEAMVTSSRDRGVILACPMSLAESWLPGCLAAFAASHPDIEVAVHGTVWAGPEDQIADVIVSVLREDEVPEGARPLWAERLVLLCAPAMAARLGAPADLERVPKIIIAGRQEYWSVIADALGLPPFGLERALRTNGSNISLEMAAHGLGATVALASLTGPHLERGRLIEPFPVRPPSPWGYYVAQRRGPRGSAAGVLMAHLQAFAARG
jgi:DNA-binding transcriptional LysR family regulator